MGHAVSQLVVFLRYKPEIRGVDFRCCPAALWDWSLSASKILGVGGLKDAGA
jgi:hypothetical protein